MVNILRTIYFWSMVVIVTILLFVLVLFSQSLAILRILPRDGSPIHWIASLWGRTLMTCMPGWRVEIDGRENLPPHGRAVVMVANHESMTDIWAMYYLGVQFRWLSKDSIFRIPIIGTTMKWCGYVAVNRQSRESGSEAMRQSALRLAMGIPMFFFPEGTRSVDGKIKNFKLGAFKLAQNAGVPVLPIVIHGAGSLFAKGSMVPGRGALIQIKVLEEVPTPSKEADLARYAEDVRLRLMAVHQQLVGPETSEKLSKNLRKLALS
jgi:1-acyl-sn-glycerol-3-phosphate acyltransferase